MTVSQWTCESCFCFQNESELQFIPLRDLSFRTSYTGIGNDPDSWKDRGQEEKGETEDEMIR